MFTCLVTRLFSSFSCRISGSSSILFGSKNYFHKHYYYINGFFVLLLLKSMYACLKYRLEQALESYSCIENVSSASCSFYSYLKDLFDNMEVVCKNRRKSNEYVFVQNFFVVERDFRKKFELPARACTPRYKYFLENDVPVHFVGNKKDLSDLLEMIAGEMHLSFMMMKMPTPPWRRLNYLVRSYRELPLERIF